MDIELASPKKEYHSKHHVYFSCIFHVIFCPKYRRKVLRAEIAERMKELIIEKQVEYGYKILAMEIMVDHVHLLIDCDVKLGIFKTVQWIKGYTSNVLRREFPELARKLPTLWTRGKFVSSVGSVNLEVIKQYIENQKHV